jgi:zinc protease
MNPTFPEEELAIMKQQKLQGVEQQQASPQFLSNREFRKQLFGSHPYARTSETKESVNGVDRAKVVAFHRDHYRPNNAFLLVVGDVQADKVFAAAEKAFGSWARGTVPQPTFAAPPALAGRHLYFVQRPNSIQSSISVGNFAVKRSDPRWFEMTLANSIYGGAFNSRIVKNIREDKGYTYSPSSQFTGFANAGFYKFAADVRNEVTGATLTEVFKEIDKMRAEGSDGTELAGAKSYMRGVFALQTATQGGLAATLNNVYTYDLPKNYPETFRSTISELTPLRVKNGANALLGSDNTVIVIVGDWAKVKDQLSAYKDITFLDINGKKIAPPTP